MIKNHLISCSGSVSSDKVEDSELDKFKDIDETSSMVKSFQIGTEIKVLIFNFLNFKFLTYRVMQ